MKSAIGSIGLIWAQKILKAARIGTANITPGMPQSQRQKVNESRTRAGFSVSDRPIIQGVMKFPSKTAKARVNRRKNQSVTEVIETEDRAEGDADNAGERAKVRHKVERGHQHAPHKRIAQAEQTDRRSHGCAETNVDRRHRKKVTRNIGLDLAGDRNGALLVGQGREQLDQLAKKDAIKGKKKIKKNDNQDNARDKFRRPTEKGVGHWVTFNFNRHFWLCTLRHRELFNFATRLRDFLDRLFDG